MMIRSILKPIEADTLDSEIEGKILKCLKSTKNPLSDRDIDIKTKIKSRKGTTHYDRVKTSLINSRSVILVKPKDKINDKRTKSKMWLYERINELPEDYEITIK